MTQENLSDKRQRAIDALVSDPMYQLSTAGQELFHTNMLYWLAVNRPAESAPIWHLLNCYPPDDPTQRGIVRREWQHVDLFVDAGLGARKLVLENKVLAIPTARQLSGYRDKLKSLLGFDDFAMSWRLLTLMPPSIVVPPPWESVSYAELIPALRETVAQLRGDDRQLVASYAQLVDRLVFLQESFDPLADLEGRIFLDDATVDRLRTGRLLSLVNKMQVSRCAEMLNSNLVDDGDSSSEVKADLTNGQGLLDWFVGVGAGRHVGWQLQGSQFRLVVLTGSRDPKKREAREKVVEAELGDYFDFALPAHLEGLLQPYMGKKQWLGYEPNFVYRYQKLDDSTSWRQFLDVAEWFTRQASIYSVNRVGATKRGG